MTENGQVTLTSADRTAHRQDVKTVQQWIKLGWLAGEALERIRTRRSYLDTHSTWDKFCQDTFGVSGKRCEQLVQTWQVRQSLGSFLPIERLPEKPAHLEALVNVDEETAAEIWEEVLEESEEKSEPVTTAKIKAKVKERKKPAEESEPAAEREPGEDEPEEVDPDHWKKLQKTALKHLEAAMRDVDDVNRMRPCKSRHKDVHGHWLAMYDAVKGWK